MIRQLQVEAPLPLKLVRVNADENLILANNYRLTALPTLLLFDNGELVYRVEGLEEARLFKEQLPQILLNLSSQQTPSPCTQ